ncbi:hypothetical protein Tco_1296934 [Tanacetum coccineum]
MEPDIKSMTLNKYLEYEADMERRSWRNDRSKIIPTKYEGAEFNSSNRDKSVTFDFSPYYEDAFFFAQPLNTPNTHVDKKDFDLVKILDDLFRTGDENLSICEQYVDLEKEEAQVEDDDDGNIYDIWDITIEDVERIKQFLTPNVPDEMDEVIQPLISKPIHTTPPKDDYVAPATKSSLDELLEEFRDEILNVTMVHSVIGKPEPFIYTQPMSPLYGVIKSSQSSTYPYKVGRDITSPECKEMGFEVTLNCNYVVKVLQSTEITT